MLILSQEAGIAKMEELKDGASIENSPVEQPILSLSSCCLLIAVILQAALGCTKSKKINYSGMFFRN